MRQSRGRNAAGTAPVGCARSRCACSWSLPARFRRMGATCGTDRRGRRKARPGGHERQGPDPGAWDGAPERRGPERGGQAERSPAVHAGPLHANASGCRNHPVRRMPEPPATGLDRQADRPWPFSMCGAIPPRGIRPHDTKSPHVQTNDHVMRPSRVGDLNQSRASGRTRGVRTWLDPREKFHTATSSANRALAPPLIAPSHRRPI